MLVTLCIYSILAIVFILVLIVGTYNQYYLQCIAITVFVLLMAARATYFIFEKVIVDPDSGIIRMKILKKSIDIPQVKSIRKVRAGQVRIITTDNKLIPVSVDDEADFISLIQSVNGRITVE